MIAGFRVEDFSLAWPNFEGRAARWVDEDAIADAYARETSGNGACLVGTDGLLALALETRDNALWLFVLLCVSIGCPGAVKRQEAALLEVARVLGAGHIAFRTHRRRGFARIMGPEWVCRGDEFSRRV
jgi:hypothetical protein